MAEIHVGNYITNLTETIEAEKETFPGMFVHVHVLSQIRNTCVHVICIPMVVAIVLYYWRILEDWGYV